MIDHETEIRNIDGERKALVYDNYSKLIGATNTIQRVRCPFSISLFPPQNSPNYVSYILRRKIHLGYVC